MSPRAHPSSPGEMFIDQMVMLQTQEAAQQRLTCHDVDVRANVGRLRGVEANQKTAGQEHLHVVSVPQGTVYLALAIRAGLTIAAGLLILSVAGH
ncbi:hypothetical protein VTJ04DRAFT_8185 [Mycothermus thermophilus]|uniref:uncharacterized protein n=1 Tax=Humicola insolens TaxID=85995 RepID=UPI003742B073